MTKNQAVEIRKTRPASISYGDRAAQTQVPAFYEVFIDGKKVGFILGSNREYMGARQHWDVCTERGRALRTFYQPNAFKRAKEFALDYPW